MTQAHIVKSAIDNPITRLASDTTISISNAYAWPIHPAILHRLYRASEVHSRSCHIKADNACGHGLNDYAKELHNKCHGGSASLFAATALDIEVYGNGFIELVRDTNRKLLQLRHLPAKTMTKTKKGFVQSVHKDSREVTTSFRKDEVLHIKNPCPGAGHYAEPDWMAAISSIGLVKAATEFNESYFTNGAMPEYAVIFNGGQPGGGTTETIKNFFNREFKGTSNAHKTLVLTAPDGSTVDIKKLTEERDGEFTKLIDSSRDRIITAHGVPPRMLGVMSSGQLGGGGEVAQQLFMYNLLTLEPRRRRMIDALTLIIDELNLDQSQVAFVKPDLTPPETDQKDRQLIAGWVQSGILSPEEAAMMLDIEKSANPTDTNIDGKPVSRPSQSTITKNSDTDTTQQLIAALARL